MKTRTSKELTEMVTIQGEAIKILIVKVEDLEEKVKTFPEVETEFDLLNYL